MILSLILLAFSICRCLADTQFELLNKCHQKFMFQHSFKAPLVTNAKGLIPFWEHGGDALPTDEQVRVCPSIQDRHGWVWNKHKYEGNHWMFDVTFTINGRNTYGADGMALWFTAQKGQSGTMFGNVPSFTGLGVVIDTFDNDGKGDSPKVALFLSNGTLEYSHGSDGTSQESKYCLRQVRNQRFPTLLKVIYAQRILEVWIKDGSHNATGSYDLCFKSEGVYLPESGYFGLSAATGGLSDDHDVMSFVVHKLTPFEKQRDQMMEELDKAHHDRLREYAKFSEDFEHKREQKKVSSQKQEDWQVRLELEENVRLVHDMQSTIVRDVKQLGAKVDNLFNMRSTGSRGGGDGVSEDKMVAMEGRLSHHLQELKSHISSSAGGKGAAPASEQMQPFYEMREKVNELQEKIDKIYSSLQEVRSNPCPAIPATSCLSTGFFTFIILVQSAVVIAFLFVKYTQERNAKKFF